MIWTPRDAADFVLFAWLVILLHTMKPPRSPPPPAAPTAAVSGLGDWAVFSAEAEGDIANA